MLMHKEESLSQRGRIGSIIGDPDPSYSQCITLLHRPSVLADTNSAIIQLALTVTKVTKAGLNL